MIRPTKNLITKIENGQAALADIFSILKQSAEQFMQISTSSHDIAKSIDPTNPQRLRNLAYHFLLHGEKAHAGIGSHIKSYINFLGFLQPGDVAGSQIILEKRDTIIQKISQFKTHLSSFQKGLNPIYKNLDRFESGEEHQFLLNETTQQIESTHTKLSDLLTVLNTQMSEEE